MQIMKRMKSIIILCLSIFMSTCFVSCSQKKSKADIQYEINDLNRRIRTLEQEIPAQRQYGNTEKAEQMEDNLRNYKIQVDELNRQLVK